MELTVSMSDQGQLSFRNDVFDMTILNAPNRICIRVRKCRCQCRRSMCSIREREKQGRQRSPCHSNSLLEKTVGLM